MKHKEKVVVLGASAQPEKFSYKAVQMLAEYGHEAIPVHPSGKEVNGMTTLRSLSDVAQPVDTLTLYVGPRNSQKIIAEILALRPKRIIMNPGAENAELRRAAEAAGITVLEDCTLVMLRNGRF
jgi:uncharacterized protein